MCAYIYIYIHVYLSIYLSLFLSLYHDEMARARAPYRYRSDAARRDGDARATIRYSDQIIFPGVTVFPPPYTPQTPTFIRRDAGSLGSTTSPSIGALCNLPSILSYPASFQPPMIFLNRRYRSVMENKVI